MIVGDTSAWDDLFQHSLVPAVLAHVVATWERMTKPGPSDLEDQISVKLYSALIRAKDRNAHTFLIGYQNVEVDIDLEREIGRKDIVFFPSLQDEEIYFCLEAKRLNALVSGVRRSLADEYVKEGMKRFVERKYSRIVRHAGMLAYVLDGDFSRAMKNVKSNIRKRVAELRMNENDVLIASTVRSDDPHCRETRHRRENEDTIFRIHHLFVAGERTPEHAPSPANPDRSQSDRRQPRSNR